MDFPRIFILIKCSARNNLIVIKNIEICMLEYLGCYGEKGFDLCFVDNTSPEEWKSEIESKLSTYDEHAFIDEKRKLNFFIVLRLEPSKEQYDDIGYMRGHINEFMNFYYNILKEIKESE